MPWFLQALGLRVPHGGDCGLTSPHLVLRTLLVSATALYLTYIISNRETSQGVAEEGRRNPEKVFRNFLRGSHRRRQEENPEWGCICLPTGSSVASHLQGPLMQPQKAAVGASRARQEPREPSLSLPSSG